MNCPCGSGKKYHNCCKRYHDGALPENALKLMKARFSAFAKGQTDFLNNTLHPNLAPFPIPKNAHYKRLVIRDFQDGPQFATVTFTAFVTINGHDATFTEKSEFEKLDGRWLYKSGTVIPGDLA